MSIVITIYSCTETVLTDNADRPKFYIDGYIDIERGALIHLKRTVPINASFRLDSASIYDPPPATIKVCNMESEFCQVLNQTSTSTWELDSLSSDLGTDITFSVSVDGEEYSTKAFFPNLNEIKYTPVSTTFRPVGEYFEIIFKDAIEHNFDLQIESPNLLPVIVWETPWTNIKRDKEPAGLYFNPSEGGSNCTVNEYSFGLHTLSTNCLGTEANNFSAFEFGEETDTLNFFISVTEDIGYDQFLQGILQDDYNDAFGGQYDVLLAEGNVEGMGGFVLFSASKEVWVMP